MVSQTPYKCVIIYIPSQEIYVSRLDDWYKTQTCIPVKKISAIEIYKRRIIKNNFIHRLSFITLKDFQEQYY